MMLCVKVFTSSLIGSALLWFNRLPQRSMASFAKLVELFINQFFTSNKQQRQTKDLFSVIQQKGESIRSYVKRFNEVKIEILYCDKSIATMAFDKGLLPESRLHHSLVKTQPDTMAEVFRRAQKYINLKEELEAK